MTDKTESRWEGRGKAPRAQPQSASPLCKSRFSRGKGPSVGQMQSLSSLTALVPSLVCRSSGSFLYCADKNRT